MTAAALVTGAGKRLGRAIALALAADGHPVAVHYNRSAADAEQVASHIIAEGGRATAVGADLSDPETAPDLIAQARDALGPLGVLINCASMFERDSLATLTADSWRAHLDVNLAAPVRLMQAFAAQPDTPHGAAIVNLLDTQLAAPSPVFFSYFCAKFGLEGATRLAALELAKQGIRVNGVAPGLVLPSDLQTQAQYEARQALTPLGVGLGPEDIVGAVRYLLAAPQVTGQVIPVDAGQSLMGFGNSKMG